MVATPAFRFLSALAVTAFALSRAACPQIEIDIFDSTPAAQGPIAGTALPKPAWGDWLAGEPVGHGKGGVTVFAFYTGRSGPTLAGDGDYLADLQRRFAERGLRVVAVVAKAAGEPPPHVRSCGVVVDDGAATTQAWFGGDPGDRHVLVLDGDAEVAWRGQPGYGLVDAIERTLNGKPELGREQRAQAAIAQLESNFDSIVGAAAKQFVDGVLVHAPRDGRALALCYLTAATKLRDTDAAAAWRTSAVDRLANLPRPLAVFADLALRGDPRNRELAVQLAAALVPATASAPNDPVVQLAYLRALVLSGKSRQVGRQAMIARKLAFGSAANCVTFCEILTQDAMPPVHRDLCEQAIRKAEELGASPRQLTALRYVVAKRCAEDAEAAAAVLAGYVERIGERVSINNDCWYFMTTLETMGRHDAFAAALAEKMLEERDQMDSFEFDTAALAMFLAGRVDEAVKLQETALERGARGNPEYVERLERYRAVAASGKERGK